MKKRRPIVIKRRCLKTIARWSLSSDKEVTFIGAGRKKVISQVVRLRNIAKDPRTYFLWNSDEYRFLMKELKRRGLKYIIAGHSHPKGLAQPSIVDWRWMGKGHREIIAAVQGDTVNISAWRIARTYSNTITSGSIKLCVK